MVLIKTANSSHKKCFICGAKNVKLCRINRKSLKHAYINHQILIKHHARCCFKHFNGNKQILNEEYNLIKTTLVGYNEKEKLDFDNLYRLTACCIFDQFKDLDYLDEKLCTEVTGMSKERFLQLVSFINNKTLYDTKARCKAELIAIYIFWLRKGIDQLSLSFLKSKSNQQQMSHYLSQARMAIYKDFTPQFLGADKSRDFYLRHNNTTVNVLHCLKEDELAVIADGTYTRIEKSANSNFQYASYSVQKLDNLMKPFILCSSDGYIIDVYGPFMATLNDSKIIDYILNNDNELLRILQPEKTTIFLDRGFRDSINILQERYGMRVMIPYCGKKYCQESEKKNKNEIIKKKQLTTEQTSQSRLVTKV